MTNSSGTRPFGDLTCWSCLLGNHEEINIESVRRKPFRLERMDLLHCLSDRGKSRLTADDSRKFDRDAEIRMMRVGKPERSYRASLSLILRALYCRVLVLWCKQTCMIEPRGSNWKVGIGENRGAFHRKGV